MLQQIYNRFFNPTSASEDDKRREFILYTLLAGFITLTFIAFIITLYYSIVKGPAFAGAPPAMLLAVVCIFLIMYAVARRGHSKIIAYLFIGICFAVTTTALFHPGPEVTQAILTYSLVLVMAGILIGAIVAFIVACSMVAVLFFVQWFVHTGQTQAGKILDDTGVQFIDVIVYSVTFFVIALVSWLSNREIQHSLARARESEKNLEKERNSLEIKVRKRTKEIEKIQMEKMLELNRFAEFGRYTATLLHDLSNPLTALTLNLDQIKQKQRTEAIQHIQNGVEYMERSIDAARRQLNSKREVRRFDTEEEVMRVISLLEFKAQSAGVEIKTELKHDAFIVGDSSHFDQVVANLVANAIDACEEAITARKRKKGHVKVVTKSRQSNFELRVTDNGVGINKDDLPHIFDAFYTTKQAGHGTGIGLAIVKTTVEKELRGSITVLSKKGGGTEMKVTLPLA